MTRLLVVLMMLFPVVAMGQAKAAKAFPLTVHVVGSKWVDVLEWGGSTSGATTYMYLKVVIQGKKYELYTSRAVRKGLLVPGDYKARLVKSKNEPSYELDRTYELEFPDGKTEKYKLEAIGEW